MLTELPGRRTLALHGPRSTGQASSRTAPAADLCPAAAPLLPAGEASSEAVCHAALSWLLTAIGLLAPLLISVWTWQPPSKKAAGAAAGGGGGLQQLGRVAMLAIAACDRKLHFWLGGALREPAARVVLTWMLLAVCWLVCSTSAGL